MNHRTMVHWAEARAKTPGEHEVRFPGKDTYRLRVSDAEASVDRMPNPAELLLASFSSSYLLTFLELCIENRIHVIEYRDHPSMEFVEDAPGRHRVGRIVLYPVISFADSDTSDLRGRAVRLMNEALTRSWIANSLEIRVEMEPRFEFRPSFAS